MVSKSVSKVALILVAVMALMLAWSGQARGAQCGTPTDCSNAANWQNALAQDYNNKGLWYQAAASSDFANAANWHNKSVGAFLSGNGSAASLYQAVANNYAHDAATNSKASGDYFAKAKLTSAAAKVNADRAALLSAMPELGSSASPEVVGSPVCVPEDGDICTASIPKNTWKCETAVHHPSDPDALGSGKPNSYACSWNHGNWLRVCDRDRDGHKVAVIYKPEFDPQWYHMWADPGCTQAGAGGGTVGMAITYRVCVQTEGCSKAIRPW
jgi:hypothetical protein